MHLMVTSNLNIQYQAQNCTSKAFIQLTVITTRLLSYHALILELKY